MTILKCFANGKSLVFLGANILASRSQKSWLVSLIPNPYIYSRCYSAAFTCTSSGILRRNFVDLGDSAIKSDSIHTDCASLPSRLCDWKISANRETFAYGGDEVDLSVWNSELAFKSHPTESSQPSRLTKKRKRNDDLFPAEIWRARNVRNLFICPT
jgi:ribosome biogenesis protein NSA1